MLLERSVSEFFFFAQERLDERRHRELFQDQARGGEAGNRLCKRFERCVIDGQDRAIPGDPGEGPEVALNFRLRDALEGAVVMEVDPVVEPPKKSLERLCGEFKMLLWNGPLFPKSIGRRIDAPRGQTPIIFGG